MELRPLIHPIEVPGARDGQHDMLANVLHHGDTVWDTAATHRAHERSIGRLLTLDPNHRLLGEDKWTRVRSTFERYTGEQQANADEGATFKLFDESARVHDTRMIEEEARGQIAKKLADVLSHETPSPDKLAEVCEKLAVEHPFLDNPWHAEMLIADMRRVFPTLGKWDFRTAEDGKAYRAPRTLPESTQALVTKIGRRAFADTAVLFSNHMYRDGIVMYDALNALGLEPHNARFVATPYPFDKRVRASLEARGVRTYAAPYSVEKTKAELKTAIESLLKTHTDGPILVFDDGGLATEAITKHFSRDMHRFRIVEITKSGERIGKTQLAKILDAPKTASLRGLSAEQLERTHQQFVEGRAFDDASRADAEAHWDRIVHAPTYGGGFPQDRAIESRQFGFAYYTYSNTAYKKETMTPLYTEQVNRSLFDAIDRSGKPLSNKRVTIIGGGAMGHNAGKELREKGFEVTFVEPDATQAKVLGDDGFVVSELRPSLRGRSIVLELSGIKNIIGLNDVFQLDQGAFLVHGSSKDNPFDMESFNKMAKERVALPGHNGQRSATYRFEVAGRKKDLHLLGDGFTISHGGKAQNVPLDKFLPELDRLVNLGVYALENKPVTHTPIFTAPESAMNPQ